MATPVELGIAGSLGSWPLLVFVVGLFTAIVLMVRKVRGAILIAIVTATVLAFIVELVGNIGSKTDETGAVVNPAGWALDVPHWPDGRDLRDARLLARRAVLPVRLHRVHRGRRRPAAGLLAPARRLLRHDGHDGRRRQRGEAARQGRQPVGTQKILVVDSIAAAAGGAGSVSSNTSYIESAAGVGDGARTGLASVVTGIAFLLATFLSPLVSMVPFEAATPALVVVGFLMVTQITGIDWKNWELAIPAFLTIILMPFTYSITAGIGAGIITFVVIKLALGKVREIHAFMWVASAMFVVYFLIGPIKSALGI